MTSLLDIVYAVFVAVQVTTVLIYAYASYWAFEIRKASASRLYRNQALGVGLLCLGFALLFISFIFNLGSVLGPIQLLPFFLPFYWIDASVLAARRSDPFLRDIYRWSKVRLILWPLLVLSWVANIPNWSPTPLFSLFFLIFLFLPFVTGAIYLPISAIRSRDTTFRRHLRWFGFFAIFLVGAAVFGALSFLIGPVAFLPASVLFVLGGYCLYRSAKSLVPLNRISLE